MEKRKAAFTLFPTTGGGSFQGEDSIAPLGRHPQLTVLAEGAILSVWDEAVRTGDQFTSFIGVQLRSREGKPLSKQLVTDSSFSATYPVATPIGDNTALIVYCKEKNNQTQITYQKVSIQ